jgi:AcrR family transcriptional regulator
VEADAKPPATRRILSAARELVARGGAGAVSIGDVATAAGVSKALVHYHFRDKDTLLQALVEDVGLAVITRAKAALAREAPGQVLDEHWTWLEAELHSGDLRILLSLAECDSDRVRAAARRIAEQRREVTTAHVAHIFTQLALNPRVPPALIAETVLAFVDGLVAVHALEAERNPRPAFDILWLALLTLAE